MTLEEVAKYPGLHSSDQISLGRASLTNQQRKQQQSEVSSKVHIHEANGTTASITPSKLSHPKNDSNIAQSSTIAIMRRHTMYDSLILVKQTYRSASDGLYTSLEFPTTTSHSNRTQSENEHSCRKKLTSVYLDGDDPMYLNVAESNGLNFKESEIVHVPINGLLTRLDTYEKNGIRVDGQVYAFAMGLKTADKFLKSGSMKEIQETP